MLMAFIPALAQHQGMSNSLKTATKAHRQKAYSTVRLNVRICLASTAIAETPAATPFPPTAVSTSSSTSRLPEHEPEGTSRPVGAATTGGAEPAIHQGIAACGPQYRSPATSGNPHMYDLLGRLSRRSHSSNLCVVGTCPNTVWRPRWEP
jgi:hypothetical protein